MPLDPPPSPGREDLLEQVRDRLSTPRRPERHWAALAAAAFFAACAIAFAVAAILAPPLRESPAAKAGAP